MDETYLEMADRLARAEIAAGISRARSMQTKPVDFDGSCDCGSEIPQGRIAAGYYNCVECQQLIETRRRRFKVP